MGTRTKSPSLGQIVGQNMRVYRAAKNMSQEDLAERAGIKRTYIGAIERGEVDTRLGTLQKIASGLGIEPFKLLLPASDQLSVGVDAMSRG